MVDNFDQIFVCMCRSIVSISKNFYTQENNTINTNTTNNKQQKTSHLNGNFYFNETSLVERLKRVEKFGLHKLKNI